MAIDAPGDFVVTWRSLGSTGSDTDGYCVQAQRFDGLFRDGFESDDTSRWPFVAP